jgi:hypothetical protein
MFYPVCACELKRELLLLKLIEVQMTGENIFRFFDQFFNHQIIWNKQIDEECRLLG